MSREAPHADVVIVGLGGAGGIAAHVLTRAGAEVVALEAGPAGGDESRLDEIGNDLRQRLARHKAAGELPTFRARHDEPAGGSPWPMHMGNAVGGSTVHYPGLSARLMPWNFESRTRIVERYGPTALPAGSTIADWPLSYEELEPYYDLVEHAIGVAGHAGNIGGEVDREGNALEAARANPYPLPPLRRSGWTRLTDRAARALGWHPYPAPAAINSVPFNGNPACTYCGYCSNNVCHLGAKGSTDANVVRWATRTGRLRIETEARVVRIDTDAGGRATGATYVKDGRERFQPAATVLLAGFTYENTRVLLHSRSRLFPNGLANGNGEVGRHYMAHVTPVVWGRFPGCSLNLWSGPWSQATCVEDWNADNFDHTGLGFVGGGMLTAAHELKPIGLATAPLPPGVPRWGLPWKQWLRDNARSVGCAVAQMECWPYDGNVLDLDPVARDPFGVPRARLTFSPRENEHRGDAFLREKLAVWLREAGAAETWSAPGLFVEARHCYGGTRMGDDPATSVVDRYGFSHEVPNLGLLGASVFPSTGGVNPTLTLQALAWRTAERVTTMN